MERPAMRVAASVLGSSDAPALATFYERLLGWTHVHEEQTWVMLRAPDDWTGLSFQYEPEYEPPVWPGKPGEQGMMFHLDIAVENLDDGVAWALEHGAKLAEYQPQDGVRVMLDPAGHPFCLFAHSLT